MTSKKPIIDERIKNIRHEANSHAYYLTIGLLFASIAVKYIFFDSPWLWADLAIILIPGIYVTIKLYRNNINEYSLRPMKTYLIHYALTGAGAAVIVGATLARSGSLSGGAILLRSIICFIGAVGVAIIIHLIVRKMIAASNPETKN